MEDQIVSAIQIAWEPSAPQSQKPAAFEYVNQLRQEPQAWEPCLNIFLRIPRHPDVVRIFSLEIVNNAIQTGRLDQVALESVKNSLLGYLTTEYRYTNDEVNRPPPDLPAIENKLAQTITYLFCILYATTWPSFFDDLLAVTTSGSGQRDNLVGVAFYLRIVNSIHDEVGDVLVAKSREEQDRSNALKDLLRARDVPKITRSWQEILSFWQCRNGVIGQLTMEGIGKWVSWIDISLVVNQDMLQLISQQVQQEQVEGLHHDKEKARDEALATLTEIVSKKMPSADKLSMIEFMGLQNMIEKIGQWPLLDDQKSPQYDVDLAEEIAKLVAVIVQDVTRVLDSEQESSDIWRKAEQMLQDFLPRLLRFFSDAYDEVCSHVLPAMTDVLAYFRKAFSDGQYTSQRSGLLIPILKAIFAKSRIDDYNDNEGDFDGDNTEEAEFFELRKRLSTLQQTIAATDEQLFMDAVSALVNDTLEKLQSSGGNMNWRDVDLALHEMYLMGDLAVRHGGLYQKAKPNSPAAERLIRMMLVMVSSPVGDTKVPALQVQYMEICNRYAMFFEKHNQYLQPVLQNFLKNAHSSNVRVRLRAWYLLQRLVRQQKHNVGTSAALIISSLQDLLPIKAELPAHDADEDDSESETADATFNSQLYLFETVGCIIAAGSVSTEDAITYAQAVMQPLFTDIQKNLPSAKTSKLLALQIHHDIMALGNIARGYFDWTGTTAVAQSNNIPSQIKSAFVDVANITLVALENVSTSFDVRTAARFTFSRLLGMVGSEMLPSLPRWVAALLSSTSSRDEMAQLLRLLDQVTYGFKSSVFAFLDELLSSLLQQVWVGISAADPSGTDDEVELAELKREYLNFLLVTLANGLGGVFVSARNQPQFETVLGTIEHFTKDITDPTTAKMAFTVLGRMCLVWAGPDVVPNQIVQNDVSMQINNDGTLPGFKEFMMSKFSPMVWAVLRVEGFNPKDAQSRQVLMEAASLQKILYAKNGGEYVLYLKQQELPALGFQQGMIDDYIAKLTSLDQKSWKSWFARFVGTGGKV